MCRLLAFVARRPITVAEALGEDDLDAFAELAPRHPDGWGLAWWPTLTDATSGNPPKRVRAVGSARESEQFHRATHNVPAIAALVHLRGATPGLTVELANCHPFVRGRAAFAQNGAILPQDRLPRLLPAALEAEVAGSTDSERFFLLLHDRVTRRSGDVPAGVADVLAEVLREFTSPCLNAMYLAPEGIYTINAHNPTTIPYDGDPRDVFALRYRLGDDVVVVASSGFDQPESGGWRTLDNMTVLGVRLGTLAPAISALAHVPVPAYSY
jgi:predicted glutamine amidotransferase